ncbi:MAG: pyridoxamine 5'-phosphate oxidase family protein [Bacteroidota bacterium]
MYTPKEFEKVRAIIDDLGTCMFVTTHGIKLKSRPMQTVKVDEDGHIWFFTERDSETVAELATGFQVNLSYACTEKNTYLSISGTAVMIENQDKIDELWSPVLKAWFPKGKEDHNLVLLRIAPVSAAYWDATSSKLVELFNIGKAIATGEKYESGEMAQMKI